MRWGITGALVTGTVGGLIGFMVGLIGPPAALDTLLIGATTSAVAGGMLGFIIGMDVSVARWLECRSTQ